MDGSAEADASAGTGGSTSGTGGTADSGSSGSAGTAGASGTCGAGSADAGTGGTAADPGAVSMGPIGGAPCAPATICWSKTRVGAGTLNKAFADNNGKLYVGAGMSYYTNATGTWESKPLNSAAWAIDGQGNPHTVTRLSGAGSSHTGPAYSYSTLVGGSWTSELIPTIPTNVAVDCYPHQPGAADVFVAPNGNPHVGWHYSTLPCNGGGLPNTFMVHSYRQCGQWISVFTGGSIEPNARDTVLVSALVDANGYFHQAFIQEDLRVPTLSTNDPQGDNGVTSRLAEGGGPIALARPARLHTFALFSGRVVGENLIVIGHGPILTEGVVTAARPSGTATLLGCPNPDNTSFITSPALLMSNQAVASAAWVRDGKAQFGTNRTGAWEYAEIGPASKVALVGTGGVLYAFVQDGADIYVLTPC